ncbi:MAG: hypothetical protein LQ343_007523 [Gyalolechia ehrenbergii]|nr:MAG: hypothetical protein LQ343_007523 [Gyalolechia ehrenbergii]
MSAYAYPPSNHGQSETYRASPTGSNVSLPSLNLPPIRTTMESRPQSQQGQQTPQHQPQQQVGQPQTAAPLPPPMGSYYGAMAPQSLPPPQHMNITSDPNQPMRYPLPPPDGRMMSGGRHKKEIKRRTKTGCLTCRKRRIKCDEHHPQCKNCQKSKRECLGYDPIFKSQPGPTAIQPAPSAAPSMQSTPTSAPPYPPPPQGYIPASSQPYAPSSLMANSHSPNAANEQNYDYHATLDPALASSLQSKASSEMYNGADPRRDSMTASPYPPGAIAEPSSIKRSRLDELVALDGVPPPAPTITYPLPPIGYDDLSLAYRRVYGPHIDKFLETQWFSNRGLHYVLQDARLCERFATLVARFSISQQDPGYDQAKAATQSLEASVIWSIMSIARRVAGTPDPSSGQISAEEINGGVLDAARRVEVLENMLLGQHLDSEAPTNTENSRNGAGLQVQLQEREREFWRLMHKFLTIRDDEASASHELDATLKDARNFLDVKENRDVIYSIALVRLHGGRENLENLSNQNNGGGNTQDKNLTLAKDFLEKQAAGKGTTQVVQRICGMAVRAWTLPR